MALLKLGAFVESVRGKAGNSVFRQTKSGTVVSDHVIPTDPNTAAQQDVRSDFGKSTQTFSTLSAPQVKAWNKYAANQKTRSKAGKLRAKTGINVFAALATKFQQVSPTGTIPLDPPTAPFLGDTISVTVSGDTGTITFEASAANASGVTTELLLQPVANANRKPSKGAFRSEMYKVFTSGSLSQDIAVGPGYYAAAYRFVKIATGQQTQLVMLPVQQVSLAVEQGGQGKAKKAA